MTATAKSLQDLIDAAGGPNGMVDYLRNVQNDNYVVPIVPVEFGNWQSEQRAWRESAVLFDQSHHMDTLIITGSDALRLITDTAVNSTAKFRPGTAKQYIAVTPDGYVIGDGVLCRETDKEFVYIGRHPAANWLRYHAETGGYSVEVETYRRSPTNPLGRPLRQKFWRFQIQGPRAWDVIEKLNGGPVEQVGFFHMSELTIDGVRARTLRHGMAGAPGLELWGPFDSYQRVREAIVDAGGEFGLVAVGGGTYPTNTLESGWIPDPLPAIYTSPELAGYRRWLRVDDCEAASALAGSYVSPDITDYYLNPWELGYGSFVKFDHDFIGRDALEKSKAAEAEGRRKVTLAWNSEDLSAILRSLQEPVGQNYKFFNLPLANYGYFNFDSVLDADDRFIGLSKWTGFSANERRGLSLAVVDAEVPIGAEVRVIWGEPAGGTAKQTVEPHEQCAVRAVVSPAPYSEVARDAYHGQGWRAEIAKTASSVV